MKITLIISFILGVVFIDINDIAKINSLKEEAENAYKKGDYKIAFEKYHMLIDSFKVMDDNLLLNYANSSYFLTGLKGKIDQSPEENASSNNAEAAMTGYQKLTASNDPAIRSAAYNQIGVINYQLGNSVQQGEKYLNESLSYFKQSLISNSANDNARYNYEVVKKKLENQQNQEQQQDQQNEDQKKENKDQQNQDQQQDQQNQEQNQENQENEEQQEEEQNQKKNENGQEDESEEQQQNPQEQDQEDSCHDR